MKFLLRLTLALYLSMLLWLVLFKTSTEILLVLTDVHIQSINMVPFTGQFREMIENFIIFIPLGILIGANFKKLSFLKKFVSIFSLSFAIEILQYVLAIGVTDINDFITNTLGGLLGLSIYSIFDKGSSTKKVDTTIIITTALILAVCLFFRFFVFKVKY